MKRPEWVVVIGASAGGINALTEVVSNLPGDLPAAVILVQHLKPDYKTQLHKYLAYRCPLQVRLAEDGFPLEAGVIYVSVPGLHIEIKDGHLALHKGKPVHYIWPSADILFSSAAEEYGSRAIGVILTGTGKDGSKGLQEIKAKGGITIAQDKETSEFFGMPEAAIKTGIIDYVLPLDEIAMKIERLVEGNVRKEPYW